MVRLMFETVVVTFGMFSALPMPRVDWTPRSMRWALACLPLVGFACGGALAVWLAVCRLLNLSGLLPAAGVCLCPLLVTGGLHMDGFADTCDALASHAEPARKQEILKDSHVGAFALIRVCMYLVAQLALASALAWDKTAALCMALGYVLERCLSGWAVAALPLAKNTGLAHAFASAADRTATARILAAAGGLSALALVCIGRIPGLAMAAAALAVLAWYRRLALREFGGLSGDLAGWFVQWCELAQLAALVLTRALLALL